MPIFYTDVYRWYSKRTGLLSKHLVPPQLYVGHGTRAEGRFWRDILGPNSHSINGLHQSDSGVPLMHEVPDFAQSQTVLSKSLCNMMIHDQFIPLQVYSLPAAHTITNKTGSYNTQPLIPPSIVFGIWRCMLKDAKTSGAMSARSADPGACPFHAARFRRGKHPGGPSTPKYWSKSSSICVSVRSFWCSLSDTFYIIWQIIKWFGTCGPSMMWQQWRATRFICTFDLLLCQWHAHCVPVKGRNTHVHSRSTSQGENVQQDFIKWSGNSLTHGEKRPEYAWVVSVELLDVVGGWILNAMLCVPSIHDSCPPSCGDLSKESWTNAPRRMDLYEIIMFITSFPDYNRKSMKDVGIFLRTQSDSEVEESKIDKDIFHEAKQLGCYTFLQTIHG